MNSARLVALFVVAASVFVWTACTSSADRQCVVGADCASGACRTDGTCAPSVAGDASTAPVTDAATGADADPDAATPDAPGKSDTGPSGTCLPDNDGVVTRVEVPFAAGLHATYRVAQNAVVSTSGVTQTDGSRQWDLSGALSGDHSVLVETLAPAGTWYAPDFSGATYASKLSDTKDLLGVFEAVDNALLLRGVASPAGGTSKTELTYNPNVTVLSFPLQDGASWTTTANVTGYGQGIPVAYTEAYDSRVDAHGTLKTPLASFTVLRVAVVLTRTIGLSVTTVRTFLFVTDCFGTVASIVSNDNETTAEFTTASEVRRLAP